MLICATADSFKAAETFGEDFRSSHSLYTDDVMRLRKYGVDALRRAVGFPGFRSPERLLDPMT